MKKKRKVTQCFIEKIAQKQILLSQWRSKERKRERNQNLFWLINLVFLVRLSREQIWKNNNNSYQKQAMIQIKRIFLRQLSRKMSNKRVLISLSFLSLHNIEQQIMMKKKRRWTRINRLPASITLFYNQQETTLILITNSTQPKE